MGVQGDSEKMIRGWGTQERPHYLWSIHDDWQWSDGPSLFACEFPESHPGVQGCGERPGRSSDDAHVTPRRTGMRGATPTRGGDQCRHTPAYRDAGTVLERKESFRTSHPGVQGCGEHRRAGSAGAAVTPRRTGMRGRGRLSPGRSGCPGMRGKGFRIPGILDQACRDVGMRKTLELQERPRYLRPALDRRVMA